MQTKHSVSAWYYGLDMTDYWKRSNAIDPLSCENNFYTMKGLCYTSDGKDYLELVEKEMGLPESDGKTPRRVDKAKAEELKKQAMEELKALGVTFPVSLDHYISGSSQAALDSANVLKQCFSDSLGDDYIVLNIKTYHQIQQTGSLSFLTCIPPLAATVGALTTVTRRTTWVRKFTATTTHTTLQTTPTLTKSQKKPQRTKLCWIPTKSTPRW